MYDGKIVVCTEGNEQKAIEEHIKKKSDYERYIAEDGIVTFLPDVKIHATYDGEFGYE